MIGRQHLTNRAGTSPQPRVQLLRSSPSRLLVVSVRMRLQHRTRLSFGAAALTVAASGLARDEVPGLLFRGGTIVPPPVVVVDPALPRGHRAGWRERPAASVAAMNEGGQANGKRAVVESRTCAPDFPVCVHGGTNEVRQAAVKRLADAYRRWNYVLAMPAPLADGSLGGGPELDVYLDASAPDLFVYLDAPSLRAPRTSAWCRVSSEHLSERTAARCIAEVSACGIDPAMGPSMRRGWAGYLVDAAYPPDSSTVRAIDDAQRQPFQPLLAREVRPSSEASSAFWRFVDLTWGGDGRGKLPLALAHVANAGAPLDVVHPEWPHSPDELDVLRHAFGRDANQSSLMWSDWAASRAFWGARANGSHASPFRYSGDAGRIAFDWSLAYSSLPRHLAGPNALHPMGAAYIWVELDSVPLHATLAFRAEWEEPAPFRWVVIAVDEQGLEMSRWNLPYVEKATSAETTIVNFEAAAGLVIVGTNLGAVDVSHPFDVDQEPWEPHGYSVYLTQLSP